MRVIIAGTRTFDDKDLLFREMDALVAALRMQSLQVVSGAAEGADKLGELWAQERQMELLQYPADWKKHGRAAGPIRNAEMARNADMCVVFWDGKSKGAKSMMEIALSKGLLVKVVRYASGTA